MMIVIHKNLIVFNGEIYCVITTAHWSRDGLAVVSLEAYIQPRLVWSQACGSCSRRPLEGLAHRSGGSLQEETELQIKDE